MKTKDHWVSEFMKAWQEVPWDKPTQNVVTAVRNEAYDACIAAISIRIKKANPEANVWLAGIWDAIYAIENLKDKQ